MKNVAFIDLRTIRESMGNHILTSYFRRTIQKEEIQRYLKKNMNSRRIREEKRRRISDFLAQCLNPRRIQRSGKKIVYDSKRENPDLCARKK